MDLEALGIQAEAGAVVVSVEAVVLEAAEVVDLVEVLDFNKILNSYTGNKAFSNFRRRGRNVHVRIADF